MLAADSSAKLTRHCLDPWRYLEISPDHGLKPCCNIPPIETWVPDGPSLDEMRNAAPFKLLREQLLSGCLPDTCQHCHIRPLVPVEKFRADLRKEFSAAVNEAGLLAQPLRVLRLEITTKCNLRCVYCPVSQPWYTAAEMSGESFDQIAALLARHPHIAEILVNGHGETTFHPEWMSLCNRIVGLGFRPNIISNLARPLNDEEVSCLAQFGVIQVSLDTVDADLLKNLRRRVKLSHVVENIGNIRKAAKSMRLAPPKFSISCGVYDANYAHLEELARFCIAMDFRSATFWQLVKYDDLPDTLNVYPVSSLDQDRIADAVSHLERAIHMLQRAGIDTGVAGGFLDEWRQGLGLLPKHGLIGRTITKLLSRVRFRLSRFARRMNFRNQ